MTAPSHIVRARFPRARYRDLTPRAVKWPWLFNRICWLRFCHVGLVVLLSGCAGYQVGPTNGQPAGALSIQVNPFRNETIEPRLTDAVTLAFRKQLQQDGTYRLATHNDGDLILNGKITRYERLGISFDPGDVITPRDYIINVLANITVIQRSTGQVIFEQAVTGKTAARLLSDMPNTERQAIPLVAEDLARQVTSLLVSGDW